VLKAILALGPLVILVVIVILLGLQGPNLVALFNNSIPTTNPDIKASINAASDAKDKVESAKDNLSWFVKLFEIRL